MRIRGARRRPWRQRLLLWLLVSSGISLLAQRRGALKCSGVPAATATGTVTAGVGGWELGLSLIFFFVSSSILSRFHQQKKASLAAEKFSKGSARDMLQVVANGGVATWCALCYGLCRRPSRQGRASPSLTHSEVAACDSWLAAFGGALATATADTWATEVGVLVHRSPRLITTGRLVSPGTSGAISWPGTLMAAAGALTTGLVLEASFTLARLLSSDPRESSLGRPRSLPLAFIAWLSGLTGSLIDSFLGATLQTVYRCPQCGQETERSFHQSCSTATQYMRGLPGINNDVVNFLATLSGCLIAFALNRFASGHSRCSYTRLSANWPKKGRR
ncbi:DUF92 domain-containing protein [Thermogemmatispora sp.]|uniref:DUF92 domain-containing protein n=1 Tax=Thermogemmatispora sp. TaxID=1968838 RepID=UPI001DA3BCA6|nr:DUF92 domain-containing protein [Thermogemmatispora sp.]MBX5449053.1 DUF92 domain-containing protein [Thermogemmatispora sp.]